MEVIADISNDLDEFSDQEKRILDSQIVIGSFKEQVKKL